MQGSRGASVSGIHLHNQETKRACFCSAASCLKFSLKRFYCTFAPDQNFLHPLPSRVRVIVRVSLTAAEREAASLPLTQHSFDGAPSRFIVTYSRLYRNPSFTGFSPPPEPGGSESWIAHIVRLQKEINRTERRPSAAQQLRVFMPPHLCQCCSIDLNLVDTFLNIDSIKTGVKHWNLT